MNGCIAPWSSQSDRGGGQQQVEDDLDERRSNRHPIHERQFRAAVNPQIRQIDILPDRVGHQIDVVAKLDEHLNPVVLAEGGAPRLEERLWSEHQDAWRGAHNRLGQESSEAESPTGQIPEYNDQDTSRSTTRSLFVAEKNGVTAITDAGIAPGLSNLIFGRVLSEFDRVDSAKCFVGGLPQNPRLPWLYNSVFSPMDVVEEYTRPARLVKNGKIITKLAMTEIEPIEFKKIGILDAFNSDGLRSLLDMPIPDMVEKTLRFPGHIQKIIV